MKMRIFDIRQLLPSVLLLCLVASSVSQTTKKLRPVFSWTRLEFAFPNQQVRDAAIKSRSFIPGVPIPIDVDVLTRINKPRIVFVTIPRTENGMPVTLGYVTDKITTEGNPIIAPYPNWEMQQPGFACSGLVSVWRIHIDRCGRLWVLDSGKIGRNQVCFPKLVAFSAQDGQVLSRYVFPREQWTDASIFVNPAVDVRDTQAGRCSDTYVYIADVGGFSLIVYDHKNSRSWKIVNNLFYPYPQYGTFTINKQSFDLMDGILGLALSPLQADGDRTLFFHSLASRVEAWVPTSIIRNANIFANNSEAAPRSFRAYNRERSSQSVAEVMDNYGVMFFGLLSETTLACWNSRDFPEYRQENIEKIVVDRETMQFPSGMKIVTPANGRSELWVMSMPFQKVMTQTLNPSETNFRIQADYLDQLTRGTKCNAVASKKIH